MQLLFVARTSFETRFVGGQTLAASANTLPLTSPATTFTRSASVFVTNAVIVAPATTSFTFGKTDRGKIERVDLQINLVIDLNEDTDRDGMPNWAELVAGTDPNDQDSVFKLSSTVEPSPQGGLTITWASVPRKSYVVSRSEALENGFIMLAAPAASGGTNTTYTDLSATGFGPYFYRIQVNP